MFCSYCGQGFKRDEHLERHILTHTNIRPFKCQECKLAFKRKDLLRRHYRSIHAPIANEDNAQNDDPTALQRTGTVARISIACVNCAQSKTKCDSQVPCGRCVKKNLACERRTFRRSSCKDTSKQISAEDISKLVADNESLSDMQDMEPSMESDQSAEPEHIPSDWSTADMLDMSSAMLPDLQLDTDLAFTFPLHDTPRTVQFDMNLGYFVDTANLPEPLDSSTASMMSGRPDSGYADPSMFLRQEDMQVLPHAGTAFWAMDTRNSWCSLQANPDCGEGLVNMSLSHVAKLRVLDDSSFWSLCLSQASAAHNEDPLHNTFPSPAWDSSTRDRLLALTQQIWHLGKEHIASASLLAKSDESIDVWMDRIVLLPPTEIMLNLLDRYASRENERFHLFPAQSYTSAAAMLKAGETNFSGMLILLLVAQVTRTSPIAAVRDLSTGLTELCRIVVRDLEATVNTEFLDTSLTLMQLLQWSGDSWHMTAAQKLWEQHAKQIQRNLFADITRSGSEARNSALEMFGAAEAESQMLYSWISVDLELSLFHDVPPKLALQDIASPGFSPLRFERRFSSLTVLFETFIEGQPSSQGGFTATSLRLLLHPLQCLSAHLYQCLATFGSIQDSGKPLNSTLGLASKAFIDELSVLLQRWHGLSLTLIAKSGGICHITRGSLILYHLMVLNNLTSFPEVERSFQTDPASAQGFLARSWMRTASAETIAMLLAHCGQCLHLLRTTPASDRPLWWAAALYRVALILTQAVGSDSSSPYRPSSSAGPESAIMVLDQDFGIAGAEANIAFQRSLGRSQGTPALRRSDGSTVLLTQKLDALDYCIALLDEHLLVEGTAFAKRVKTNLGALRSGWSV